MDEAQRTAHLDRIARDGFSVIEDAIEPERVTALITLATPLIILLMLLLQNKKTLMGEHTPGRATNGSPFGG